jgi:hypothetical protein
MLDARTTIGFISLRVSQTAIIDCARTLQVAGCDPVARRSTPFAWNHVQPEQV